MKYLTLLLGCVHASCWGPAGEGWAAPVFVCAAKRACHRPACTLHAASGCPNAARGMRPPSPPRPTLHAAPARATCSCAPQTHPSDDSSPAPVFTLHAPPPPPPHRPQRRLWRRRLGRPPPGGPQGGRGGAPTTPLARPQARRRHPPPAPGPGPGQAGAPAPGRHAGVAAAGGGGVPGHQLWRGAVPPRLPVPAPAARRGRWRQAPVQEGAGRWAALAARRGSAAAAAAACFAPL
jgi:translation initiation factor IF-2